MHRTVYLSIVSRFDKEREKVYIPELSQNIIPDVSSACCNRSLIFCQAQKHIFEETHVLKDL